jgi:predicted metal-dependent phosphoesterase TrpH
MLISGGLDVIAVTDHNTITMAQQLHEALGDTIIIGEEITAIEGEIIGLYLTSAIPAGMSVADTIQAIRQQGGLVYVPHPFETVRKGITLETLTAIAVDVDILEVNNGRAVFQNYSKQALDWATKHNVCVASASDAHGRAGWGRTFTIMQRTPTRANVLSLLKEAGHQRGFPGVRGVMYPKFNRMRKRGQHA